MTSLAVVESRYGQLVRSVGAQIFGIEGPASFSREGEKLKIGTPDGFVKIDVRLNQANIDLVLRVCTGGTPGEPPAESVAGPLAIRSI